MKKSFEKFPKIRLVWNMAYRELKAADRWFLIGCSFPESDYYLRWLLREAYRRRESPPEVTLVNPDEDGAVGERIRRMFGLAEPKAWFNSLKEFVNTGTNDAQQQAMEEIKKD